MRLTAATLGLLMSFLGGSLASAGMPGTISLPAAVPPPGPAPEPKPIEVPAPPVREEPPLRPTDRRDLFSPMIDLLILAALAGWLWKLQSRRRREDNLFTATVYDQHPASRLPLRAVTYPSEAHASELKRFKQDWIDEFCSLQYAWAHHDLRPVTGILGSQIRGELEKAEAEMGPAEDEGAPELVVRQADPADTWQEDGKEYVTVHFSGTIKKSGETASEEFDEYWTFMRDIEEGASVKPWVVTAIRRGTRERSLPRLAHHHRQGQGRGQIH